MPLDIKICGLKTAEALAAALAGGASHVGFIFFPKSPRNIAPEEAGRLRQAARGKAMAVAVTVDADDALLDEIVAAMAPDMLQLHGHESPARVAEVKARYGLPVMKALLDQRGRRPRRDRSLCRHRRPLPVRRQAAEGVGAAGRQRRAVRLAAARRLDAAIDYMLSGGLNAGNVGEALRRANPPGIDISSGVESAPGRQGSGADRGIFPGGARRKRRQRRLRQRRTVYFLPRMGLSLGKARKARKQPLQFAQDLR